MELKIAADLSGAEKLMQRFPEAARAVQISRITEALLLAEGAIKEKTPVGAGPTHLRDTIFHKVQGYGTPIWGLVSTPAKYGEPVELGTRPHFPPVAPIQHWVEKKLGYSGKEAKSIAYLIARSIWRRGTKGQKMFSRSFRDLESRIVGILNRIPDDIVAKLKTQ
ncbi:MAG: hypothetical protein KBG09_06350 [Syntrophobacterales bacterium]|jgi:hypothetical protein|nr:hypothetical protein [Syntrophobacterales bacterium]